MKVLVSGLALALVLGAASAGAASFVLVSDEHLADRATAVVDARVLSVEPAPAAGIPATDYMIEVDRVVAGEVSGRNLIVRLPGGTRPDGLTLALDGVPRFSVGDALFLFLRPSDDGTYHVLDLMQGVFHPAVRDGKTVLSRDLAGARELAAPGEPEGSRDRYRQPRAAEAFRRWIADRARGVARPADYFLPAATGEAAGSGSVSAQYRLFTGADDSLNMRWFDFDEGQSQPWHIIAGGQPGFTESQTAASTRAAIAAWDNAAGTNIRYTYAGTVAHDGGQQGGFDGVNAIIFDDADGSIDDPFDCGPGGGGTLAVGGPWYQTNALPGPHGKFYHPIAGGFIVVNKDVSCYLTTVAKSVDQLYAHELGHTLGFHHPCDDPCSGATPAERDALMFPFLHGDARGAKLGSDDLAAAQYLYPGSTTGGGVPAPPSDLEATALAYDQVQLAWVDNSADETSFRVEMKMPGGSFALVGNPPADAESLLVDGLAAETTYVFRIRARGPGGSSAWSPTASVTTPTALPVAPQSLAAESVAESAVVLTWVDRADNEDYYLIEARSATSAGWAPLGTVPADASAFVANGLLPDLPYTFRVTAVNAQGSSEAAEISATPHGAFSGCTPSSDVLCLRDRFRVAVRWKNQHPPGGNGSGKGQPLAGDESGTFWFFDSANTELIVKVLDGSTVNQHFWVFYGGLSDVEYWVDVVDTATGAAKTYHNAPGGQCGRFDTAALPGDVGPGAPASTAAAPLTPAAAPAGTGACAEDERTLCLLDGRFAVTVDWTNQHNGGQTGVGHRIDGSDQTGYFWFFNPGNVELVVKMIDARSLDGHFWVFYGSLSDVDFKISVTDTEAVQTRDLSHPAGSQCGEFNTSAFPVDAGF